jgi:hypothetical protein
VGLVFPIACRDDPPSPWRWRRVGNPNLEAFAECGERGLELLEFRAMAHVDEPIDLRQVLMESTPELRLVHALRQHLMMERDLGCKQRGHADPWSRAGTGERDGTPTS